MLVDGCCVLAPVPAVPAAAAAAAATAVVVCVDVVSALKARLSGQKLRNFVE